MTDVQRTCFDRQKCSSRCSFAALLSGGISAVTTFKRRLPLCVCTQVDRVGGGGRRLRRQHQQRRGRDRRAGHRGTKLACGSPKADERGPERRRVQVPAVQDGPTGRRSRPRDKDLLHR